MCRHISLERKDGRADTVNNYLKIDALISFPEAHHLSSTKYARIHTYMYMHKDQGERVRGGERGENGRERERAKKKKLELVMS